MEATGKAFLLQPIALHKENQARASEEESDPVRKEEVETQVGMGHQQGRGRLHPYGQG